MDIFFELGKCYTHPFLRRLMVHSFAILSAKQTALNHEIRRLGSWWLKPGFTDLGENISGCPAYPIQ
jgi:hypothetical protein